MERRKRKTSLTMWVLLAIMVVGMGGFGMSSVVSGTASRTAITVGEVKVDADDFNSSYQNQLAQMGEPINASDAEMLGIPNFVLRRQIQLSSLRDSFQKNDFEISDTVIATKIQDMEVFRDATGNFNRDQFYKVLQNNNLSENQLVQSIRSELESDLMISALTQFAPRQQGLVDLTASISGETRGVEFIQYDAHIIDSELTTPSEEMLKSYYDSHKQNYLGAPHRELELAYLVPDINAVDEAEAHAKYDENKSQFQTPGHIQRLYTLSLDNEADAKAITTLDALLNAAKSRDFSEADYLTTDVTLDQNQPDLLQKAGTDGIYGPVKNPFGYTVYFAEGVKPAQTSNYEDVSTRVKEELALSKMREKLATDNAKTQDLIAGGASPKTIADETAYEFAKFASEDVIAGVSDDPAFLNAVESLELDQTSAPIDLRNGGVAFVKITSESEAMIMTFEEVRERVTSDWQAEERRQKLEAFHNEIMAEVKSGRSLSEIAEERGLHQQSFPNMTRSEAQNDMPIAVAAELFSRQVDEVWDVLSDSENYIIKLTSVKAFDPKSQDAPEILLESESNIKAMMTNLLIVDYADAHAKEVDTEINQKLIDQITGQGKSDQ